MNFKKIILSTSLFLATSGYSVAQDADSVSVDTSKVTLPTQVIETKQLPDTIWEYGYPVFERPLVVLDDDGKITSFRCSGLTYENLSYEKEDMWSDSRRLRIYSHKEMWQAARDDLSKRLGIKDQKQIDLLIIETLAYHEKKKSAAEKAKKAGIDWRNQPYKEWRYLKSFEEKLAQKNWGLNSKGRIAYERYLRRQRSK